MLDLDDLVYVEFLCDGEIATVEYFAILDEEFDEEWEKDNV